jgi:hypothetical protein
MQTFSITDPVFTGIRQEQGLNAVAFQNFVNAVNTNPKLNELIQLASYNGDVGIRLVDTAQLTGNGAGAQYQNWRTASTTTDYFNEKYEIQLNKGWFVDSPGSIAAYTQPQGNATRILLITHELSHYTNQAVYDAARAVRDEPTLNPNLTAVERSVLAVRMVMEAEVEGWYKGLETLRAEYAAGHISQQMLNRYTSLGFVEVRLSKIEADGIALGLSGDNLSRYVAENGVGVIAQMGNYLATNVAQYTVPGTNQAIVSSALVPASLDPNQIREFTEEYHADGSVVSVAILNNGNHVTRINDSNGGLYNETIAVADSNGHLIVTQNNASDANNTCRREDYTTTSAGEHITTQSTYTAGFDSPVASREVITTNAAGTLITDALDSNADGTIDKTTTKVDADHNGIAESTTVALTGGDTTFAYDANQDSHAEAVYTYHGDGSLDLSQTDEAQATWANIQTHYDAQGRADFQTIAYDNGNRAFNDWDQTNTNATINLTTTTYDAQGRLDTQYVYNDDGSRYVSDWDQAKTDSTAALTTTYFDTQGYQDLQVVTNDNGSYQVTDTDQTNATGWTTATTNYTSNWTADNQTLHNKDGGTTVNDWDLLNTTPWSFNSMTVDAQGRSDIQQVYNHDGSRYTTDWDQGNANGTVALTTTYYDVQNRQDLQVVTNDNGSYQVTDTDLTNATGWTTATTNYTSNWTADNQTLHNKDGGTTVNDWDLTNAYGWSVATTNYDAAGRQTTLATVADGGAVAQNWQWHEWDENVADYGYVSQSRQVAVYRTETYTDFRYVTSQIPDYGFDDFGFTYISGYHTIQERQAYSATRQVLDHYDTVTDTVYEVTGYHLVHHADWVLL